MSAAGPVHDLHDLDLTQLAGALRRREVSALEVAQHFLARIEAGSDLGAFLATDPDATLAEPAPLPALPGAEAGSIADPNPAPRQPAGGPPPPPQLPPP